jgi:hypothetical protein
LKAEPIRRRRRRTRKSSLLLKGVDKSEIMNFSVSTLGLETICADEKGAFLFGPNRTQGHRLIDGILLSEALEAAYLE